MDTETIKLLLDTQEKSYRGSLQVFLDQIFTKISELTTEVTELKSSLEFSQREIDELRKTVRGLRESCDSDRREIASLLTTTEDLQARTNDLDDGSRRNNLRIDGLEETPWETGEQSIVKVQAFLKEQLSLEDMPLDHAHRVGPPRDRRPRTLLVRFSRSADRDAAMRNARKLRGSVFIYEDLCPESQRIKKERYNDYKKAKSEGKIAYFVRSKLIIRDRQSSNEVLGRPLTLPPAAPPTDPPTADTSSPNTSTTNASTINDATNVATTIGATIQSRPVHTTTSQTATATKHDSDAALPQEASTSDSQKPNDKRKLRDRR